MKRTRPKASISRSYAGKKVTITTKISSGNLKNSSSVSFHKK